MTLNLHMNPKDTISPQVFYDTYTKDILNLKTFLCTVIHKFEIPINSILKLSQSLSLLMWQYKNLIFLSHHIWAFLSFLYYSLIFSRFSLNPSWEFWISAVFSSWIQFLFTLFYRSFRQNFSRIRLFNWTWL